MNTHFYWASVGQTDAFVSYSTPHVVILNSCVIKLFLLLLADCNYYCANCLSKFSQLSLKLKYNNNKILKLKDKMIIVYRLCKFNNFCYNWQKVLQGAVAVLLRHSGEVTSTVPSQEEGPWFKAWVVSTFLCGVSMFFSISVCVSSRRPSFLHNHQKHVSSVPSTKCTKDLGLVPGHCTADVH